MILFPEIMIIKINPEIIPYRRKIQALCKVPYYGHSRGCPNYAKKEGCPPGQLLINKVLDFKKDIFVIYTVFCVGEFAERMGKKHPDWNDRQNYNPRYWQPTARKFHRMEENKALEETGIEKIINSPEAHGVDLTGLMKEIGIRLKWDWPPEHKRTNKVYIISLGGYSL
ncbi:hypothetical protein JW949_02900 [Candidatus Woesearchaeota archaeon]|nr:hypothetical protein [Candidatus Woesearchaeota archaeon]